MAYVLKHWSKLPDFLSELQHHCPAFRKGLQKNFTEQNTVILLQLTAIVEVGEAFVQATYILEGDGPLSIYAWRIILGLQLHCAQVKESLPRTQRVAEQLPGAAPNTIESHMKTIRAGIEPALTYFDQKFSVDLRTAMVCFEAFDLCNPINICHMSSAVVAEKLNKLHGINMKFLTSQHVLQRATSVRRTSPGYGCGRGCPTLVQTTVQGNTGMECLFQEGGHHRPIIRCI